MKICLSGSTEFFSLALIDENNLCVAENTFRTKKIQKNAIPLIEQMLEIQKLKLEDLTGIGIDTGPGMFTGLRMAVTMAKTFAFSLELPLFTCSSLELIRWHFSHHEKVVVLMDGKQGRLFTQIFNGTETSEIKDTPIEEVKKLLESEILKDAIVVGNGTIAFPELAKHPENCLPVQHFPSVRNMPFCWQGPFENEQVQAEYYRKTQAEEAKDANSGN